MLPARHGDCLWIEYGKGKTKGRVLIDGGPADTYAHIRRKIDALPPGSRNFELMVLTHVDADHVEGLVRLFADLPLPFSVKQVWFNGWRQMAKAKTLGALQAEFLSALLVRRAPRAWDPDAKPWVIPAKGKLPRSKLPGGLELTLLSPSVASLQKMADEWKKKVVQFKPGDLDAAWAELAKRKSLLPKDGLLGASSTLDKLLATQFTKDSKAPNGSSIAFLAEYGGKSVLLLADAHPNVICDSLKRLCAERGVDRIAVDAVKISHHGSKGNTNRALLELVESPRYMISTNGDQFHHPDPECLARIVRYGEPREIHFNYSSEFTKPWINKSAQKKYGYEAFVRPKNENALSLEL